jgi:hypothetical protein
MGQVGSWISLWKANSGGGQQQSQQQSAEVTERGIYTGSRGAQPPQPRALTPLSSGSEGSSTLTLIEQLLQDNGAQNMFGFTQPNFYKT